MVLLARPIPVGVPLDAKGYTLYGTLLVPFSQVYPREAKMLAVPESRSGNGAILKGLPEFFIGRYRPPSAGGH